METTQITLVTKAQNGKVTVHTEIPVSDDAETYIVTIAVAPQPSSPLESALRLDQLYGALEHAPLPEITTDPLPERRDEL